METRGRNQKTSACSEGISVREVYLSALILQLLWSILFIFCLLAPEGMNSIVFGRDKGGMVGSLLLTRMVSLSENFIYLLSHYISYGLFFLFSASWLQRNERNSLWENKGERSEVYCLLGRYLCHGILFTCSHITFVMVYSFYFLLLGSRRNEFIVYNDSWRYHLISIDSIAETVSE